MQVLGILAKHYSGVQRASRSEDASEHRAVCDQAGRLGNWLLNVPDAAGYGSDQLWGCHRGEMRICAFRSGHHRIVSIRSFDDNRSVL